MVYSWILPHVLLNTLFNALVTGLFTAVIVVFVMQRLIEGREQRNRLHALKLQLYMDVVDLIEDNEQITAEVLFQSEGQTPPLDIQQKWINIHHRFKLLCSRSLLETYDN